MSKTIVCYETQHGSAKRAAEIVANKLGCRYINVDTPFEAENPDKYDNIVLVFNFRGPYTAQLTKLFLKRMAGKLNKKNLVIIGEGIFSEKEFPGVADDIKALCPAKTFTKYFIKGQLRVATLTSEEQVLLDVFSKHYGVTITDMGEFDVSRANEIAEELKERFENEDDEEENFVEEILPNGKKRWICTVCGYVYEGDNPPENCPLCGAPASKFKLAD